MSVTRQITPRKYRHIVLSLKVSRESFVVSARYCRPKIEARVRQPDVQNLSEHRCDGGELFTIHLAVDRYVSFIFPGGDAGRLNHAAHGAAVIGPIEQELFKDA